MQAGGHRFDPVILHHFFEKVSLKGCSATLESSFLASMFFNNLEEVKTKLQDCDEIVISMGNDCKIKTITTPNTVVEVFRVVLSKL